jgi:hypothetical protein
MFMVVTTNATTTQARKPPPAPSARTSPSRQSSVRPARRMSNRPSPFETAQRAATATRVNQAVNPKPATATLATHASLSEQGPSVQSSVTRDDVVRAVMPELQVLLRHMVDTSIERAIAPLLDRQRELESTIRELRQAQARPAQAPLATTTPTTEARAVQTQSTAVVARPAQPMIPDAAARAGTAAIVSHTINTRSNVTPMVVFDTTPLDDIPLELNGGRRTKAILWGISVAVVLAIASAIVLSVLSNQGTYL